MSHRFRLFQFDREHHRTDRRGRRGHGWLIGLLALMIALPPILQFPGAAVAANLPGGFRDEFVADVDRPTAVAFTPGGLLLATQQTGQLWVIDGEGQPANPALDLSAEICVYRNRGLLGVAVDPKFTQNRAIYLYYTFNKSDRCPTYADGDDPETNPVTRVSRFILKNDNTVDRDSETILLNDIPSYSEGIHDAGDLNFGKDGYLYVTVGDAVCDIDQILAGEEVTRCDTLNPNAQKMNLLYGKILRITRDGGIPRDNPYRGNGTSRCGKTGGTGMTAPGRICQEIFASGLRNPFRFAFDPSARGTRFFINDVGNSVWEEIDVGKAGANYGYNRREGYCRIDSTEDCGKRNPPRGLTNPIHAYNHNTGCRSVTGGAFSPVKTDWPAAYQGDYFYADLVCGKIFTLSESRKNGFRSKVFADDFGVFSLVDLAFGPANLAQPNGDRALYYATFKDGAEIRRIAFGEEVAAVDGDKRAADETDATDERQGNESQDRRDRTSDAAPPLSANAPTDQHGDTLDRERDQRNDQSDQVGGGRDRSDADAAPPKDDEGGRGAETDSPNRGDAGAQPPKNRERSD